MSSNPWLTVFTGIVSWCLLTEAMAQPQDRFGPTDQKVRIGFEAPESAAKFSFQDLPGSSNTATNARQSRRSPASARVESGLLPPLDEVDADPIDNSPRWQINDDSQNTSRTTLTPRPSEAKPAAIRFQDRPERTAQIDGFSGPLNQRRTHQGIASDNSESETTQPLRQNRFSTPRGGVNRRDENFPSVDERDGPLGRSPEITIPKGRLTSPVKLDRQRDPSMSVDSMADTTRALPPLAAEPNDIDGINSNGQPAHDDQSQAQDSESDPSTINVVYPLGLTMGLFASIAANLFFGWIAYDTHARYQDLVDDMNESETRLTRQDRRLREEPSKQARRKERERDEAEFLRGGIEV